MSGYTTSTTSFNPNLSEIFEESFERCGLELRTGYDFRTARRSLNLLLTEWANRGINLWTIEQGTISLVQGQITYDLPNDTVDLLEHVIRTNPGQQGTQSDININRISVSTYATIPNKLTQGRPIQVWVNRRSGQTTDAPGATPQYPQINVWPSPDQGTAQTPYYYFVYWRLRRMVDAGNGVNVEDIPFRFHEAMICGLAYRLAMKLPGGLERLQFLKAQYDEAWEMAAGEDREKAPDRLVPRMITYR
jgi:hypothetical protein